MAATRRKGSLPRSAALIALAALAVHQLRYLLAFGSGAHEELTRQGHAYLIDSLPALIGVAVATLAAGLLRAALQGPGRGAVSTPRLRVLLYAASIATVFAIQETSESLLFNGHASGISALVGAGGWLALPLAALLGVVCAALDGGLAMLESLVGDAVRSAPRLRAPRRLGIGLEAASIPLASLPLEFGLARRPPPPSV